ncbi:hypothetical protein A2326_00075 [candidate division WWE3 bacterium RIFOXYB2_FULL_41_6]|nr:MAG: hypothetical protein A2326_00075 [candidate division WWE3 bacterium RIFOXYB2_FULL_41_6]
MARSALQQIPALICTFKEVGELLQVLLGGEICANKDSYQERNQVGYKNLECCHKIIISLFAPINLNVLLLHLGAWV